MVAKVIQANKVTNCFNEGLNSFEFFFNRHWGKCCFCRGIRIHGLRSRWLTRHESKRTVHYLSFQDLFSTNAADVLTIPTCQLRRVYQFSCDSSDVQSKSSVNHNLPQYSYNHEYSRIQSQPFVICLSWFHFVVCQHLILITFPLTH